jgi:hypothetical protein
VLGNRRETRWLMPENTVKEFVQVYKDAEKVEGSLEIREVTDQSTSDFLRSRRTSEQGSTTSAPGNSSESDSSKG